jgi:hypothetical protein
MVIRVRRTTATNCAEKLRVEIRYNRVLRNGFHTAKYGVKFIYFYVEI